MAASSKCGLCLFGVVIHFLLEASDHLSRDGAVGVDRRQGILWEDWWGRHGGLQRQGTVGVSDCDRLVACCGDRSTLVCRAVADSWVAVVQGIASFGGWCVAWTVAKSPHAAVWRVGVSRTVAEGPSRCLGLLPSCLFLVAAEFAVTREAQVGRYMAGCCGWLGLWPSDSSCRGWERLGGLLRLANNGSKGWLLGLEKVLLVASAMLRG